MATLTANGKMKHPRGYTYSRLGRQNITWLSFPEIRRGDIIRPNNSSERLVVASVDATNGNLRLIDQRSVETFIYSKQRRIAAVLVHRPAVL